MLSFFITELFAMHYNSITQECETEIHRHDPSGTEKGLCFEAHSLHASGASQKSWRTCRIGLNA